MQDTHATLNQLSKYVSEMATALMHRDKAIARLMSSMQMQMETTSVGDYVRILEDHQNQIDVLNKECAATLVKYIEESASKAGLLRKNDVPAPPINAEKWGRGNGKVDESILVSFDDEPRPPLNAVHVDQYWVSRDNPTELLVLISEDKPFDLPNGLALWCIDDNNYVIALARGDVITNDGWYVIIKCDSEASSLSPPYPHFFF